MRRRNAVKSVSARKPRARRLRNLGVLAVGVTVLSVLGPIAGISPAGASTNKPTSTTRPPTTRESTAYTIYLKTNLDRLPKGTTSSNQFTYESHCVKTALAQWFITNPGSIVETCGYDKTWAEYKVTVETPTKQLASQLVRLQQTSSPNIVFITFEGQCLGASLACSGDSQSAYAISSHALAITFTLGPLPTGPQGYTFCASEGLLCTVSGNKEVAYGAGGKYLYKTGVTAPVTCNTSTFGGDPIYGTYKSCYIKD